MPEPIRIVFEGDFACFTRPEFAAERMSYDVPPPTAARGMVESIFWKPQVRFRINSVGVLRHSSGRSTRFMRLTTNEVKTLTPSDVTHTRTQRRCLVLRDVAYLVEVEVLPGGQPITKAGHCLTSYREMLARRVEKGQCVETPCLGLRDYPATFRLATQQDMPVNEDRPLGPMTYLVWRHDNWQQRDKPIKAERQRVTVVAAMERGVVAMRDWLQ